MFIAIILNSIHTRQTFIKMKFHIYTSFAKGNIQRLFILFIQILTISSFFSHIASIYAVAFFGLIFFYLQKNVIKIMKGK